MENIDKAEMVRRFNAAPYPVQDEFLCWLCLPDGLEARAYSMARVSWAALHICGNNSWVATISTLLAVSFRLPVTSGVASMPMDERRARLALVGICKTRESRG